MIKVNFRFLRLFFVILMSAINLLACNFGATTQGPYPPASLTADGSLTPQIGVSSTSTVAALANTDTPPASITPVSFVQTPGLGEPTRLLSFTITAPPQAATS